MNAAPRRRKKRPVHGLKTVEVSRGKSGYGFTISGMLLWRDVGSVPQRIILFDLLSLSLQGTSIFFFSYSPPCLNTTQVAHD